MSFLSQLLLVSLLLLFQSQQRAFGFVMPKNSVVVIGNHPTTVRFLSQKQDETTTATTEEEEDALDDLIQEFEQEEEEEEEETTITPADNAGSGLYFFNGYSSPKESDRGYYSPFLEKDEPEWMKKLGLLPSRQRRRSKKKMKTNKQPITITADNNNDAELDEDGYADMKNPHKRSRLKQALKAPFQLAKRVAGSNNKKLVQPGTLILVRHGESAWNKNKTFTGWADPDLTEMGRREMEHAARLLMAGGYKIDVAFTSRLKRAIRSIWILLQELDEVYLPVFKSWRLNERMYGALTGLSKTETAEQLGQELVQEWRGSLKSRPPALTERDAYWPGRERRYADLTLDQIPLTESLLDCMERTTPLWEKKIQNELSQGNNVLVVAHANTLRGLVKTIDNIGDAEIQDVAIPTGIPIIYKFDHDLKAIPPDNDNQSGDSVGQVHMNGLFLEKPGILKEALKREAEWAQSVPGYDDTMSRHMRPMTSMERSLYKLNATRELGEWASEFIDYETLEEEDDGNDGNGNFVFSKEKKKIEEEQEKVHLKIDGDAAAAAAVLAENSADSNNPLVQAATATAQEIVAPIYNNRPCVTSVPSGAVLGNSDAMSTPIRRDSVIVIIRHGKTQHNKLGLFTGWEDAPLADEGIAEAKEAGRLLKLHGFEFDVVYTSWLSRALETAWYVMDEMDALWLPIIKTWRLNERMYGELTGLSKQMVKQRHGEQQFKAWRRGYDVRPPPVSSFSPAYPGNDERYQKYLKDTRYSFGETLIRSIERRQLVMQRKLPKTESLKDCMERTIPYFKQRIAVDAVDQGKRVLISSSENAIRGLLMHLCEIPESEITGLEIPNGLPLIYDVKSKCVKLLDDGTGRDPLEVYNFGEGAKYLFTPCQNEDGTPDDECAIDFAAGKVSISLADQEALDKIKRGSP
mmetsp:Transcript_6726/g.10643  ORF Transcript_6726/g.10643 Transcript_6726/m.10643 type:complete len:918 (+) Transcript_6726:182-2935(+)|eukprot:CAMPEP_0194221356 /NCGR_PEP_ID=MMETSP0156-20130528/30383_1 /TAXON_ID=33649 /ORGANISM="Thalassionema nitzschioides, Strain L26-B" /LENGTH=917 /DNA_ID=CAMNT_0038951725 /DNA_START=169 /DNA_END=2922 /DNA_ORIENTATION=+